MPSPSPYLQASLARWADRQGLARRDVEIMMEGLEVKGHFLEGLRLKILQHRKEDSTQLQVARQESWTKWDERLKRLEAWMGSTAGLIQASNRLRSWKNRGTWFERAQTILDRFNVRLEKNAVAMERQLSTLTQETQEWCDRLILKESELSTSLKWGTSAAGESVLTSGKKSEFLNAVYAAREKEGQMARQFKALRARVNLILERFALISRMLSDKADADPGYFEIRKNQVVEDSRPLQRRFTNLRESALQQALLFEGGRTRLRGLYDMLQKTRAIQDEPVVRRPLLERLFNPRVD